MRMCMQMDDSSESEEQAPGAGIAWHDMAWHGMAGFDRRLHACMRIYASIQVLGQPQPPKCDDDRKVASDTMCLLALLQTRRRKLLGEGGNRRA
jgi:hypothetical protein